ncbi:Ig-like domain-containing protein [Fulvivirga sp. M361]|uniref:Ig-like domain-containing protein n=1 Tax=Fulvivirga sp. M361 TaxID=2594266 RepID=UPI001C884E6B|nr:Ig-like domain-containing protein [Fulvivirga sp. M361]
MNILYQSIIRSTHHKKFLWLVLIFCFHSLSLIGQTNTSLPERVIVGYWHNFDNGSGFIRPENVSPKFDVVHIAFAEPVSGSTSLIDFTPDPANITDADFRAGIKTLQDRGQEVIISIGGANGLVRLNTIAERDEFITSMISIIEDYGFDGMDIDFEGQSLSLDFGDDDFRNPTTPVIVNLINAINAVTGHFGSDFILTMAPETFFVQVGYSFYGGISAGADRRTGAYLPVIHALRDKLTFLQVQYYNSGSVTALDNQAYAMGNANFYVALVDMILKGFPVARDNSKFFPPLRQDQVLIGLPANVNAGGGFAPPAEVQKALDYLIKGIPFGGSYSLSQSYPDLRGLMTWSINWDAFNNFEFSNTHRAYLDALGSGTNTVVTITSPVNNSSFSEGDNINITASVSGSSTITQVHFFVDGTSIGVDTTSPYSTIWNSATLGGHSITARATDSEGVTTNTLNAIQILVETAGSGGCNGIATYEPFPAIYNLGDIVQFEGNKYESQSNNLFNVTPGTADHWWKPLGPCGTTPTNEAPEVTITGPVNNSSFTAGATITINANATDDVSVSQVEFFASGNSIGVDSSSPFNVTWSTATTGNYALTATATDNAGATGTSSPVQITIIADNNNISPTASITSPAAGSTFDQGTTISITANASDDDGSVSQVEFFASDASIGVDTSDPYSIAWSGAPVGTSSLTAVATDNEGATGTSTSISITVETVSTGGCNGIPAYEPFPAIYNAGDIVQYQAVRYESLANNLFNVTPGTADHWWKPLGPCIDIPVNEDPEVAITSPANNSTFTVGNSINITANATDDKGVAQVEFFVDGISIGVDTSSPYSATWNSTAGSHNLTATATDNEGVTSTSSIVRISDGTVQPPSDLAKHIMVGYWHNFDNGAAVLELGQVSTDWDVVNIAFAEPATFGGADMAFFPSSDVTSDAKFRQDVRLLQSRGQKVLISMGGANGRIELLTPQDAQTFSNAMINIIETYGFDGMDIDLEGTSLGLSSGDNDFRNPTSPKIVNFIAGTQAVLNHFGPDFILTAAPETAFVQGGNSVYAGAFGAYLPVIYHFRNDLDYIHVQDYNSGCMLGLDGICYSQGTADFHVAMTEMLLQGFPVAGHSVNFPALKQEQVAFGVPASPQAAGGGYTNPQDIQKALDYLIKGTSFGGNYSLVNSNGYPNLRGLMTWSINWDVFSGFGFSTPHRAYLDALDQPAVARMMSASMEEVVVTDEVVKALPNPFRENVTFTFSLPEKHVATLVVMDPSGREIKQIFTNKLLEPGAHEVTWDATDTPSGLYFYRLSTPDDVLTYRLIKH